MFSLNYKKKNSKQNLRDATSYLSDPSKNLKNVTPPSVGEAMGEKILYILQVRMQSVFNP